MNVPVRQRRRFRGFLLLEVVLALAVFAAAGVSFAVIFQQMGKSASLTQAELRMTRVLDSALDDGNLRTGQVQGCKEDFSAFTAAESLPEFIPYVAAPL